MNAPRIETGRLDLRPLPARAAAALPADRDTAARLVGAMLPDAWPGPDLLEILPIQAAASPDAERYGIWIVIERETNSVVGDIGFLGPPAHGVVEVGFSVLPERRGRGYATEAATLLVTWALGQPDVRRVVARCDVDNRASIRVLERAGLFRVREADGVIYWESEA